MLLSAKPYYGQNSNKQIAIKDKELHFLELKTKKELNDKKNSILKKYTLAILAAREFKLTNHPNKSLEFYRLAQDIKVEIDKKEIKEALKSKLNEPPSIPLTPFYFNANLKELISSHSYEKAILAINPEAFQMRDNDSYRIIYDLLNVKLKKQNIRRLYCLHDGKKDLEENDYQSILCDYLNEYIKDGKKDQSHLNFVEEYFLKKDLNQRYLLTIVRDL